MARDMDQFQRIARADQIKTLLENDHVIEAFASIETRFLTAIRRSSPTQRDEREQAYLVLRGLDEFMSELTKILNDGKVARVQAAEAEADAE